ncbi:GNAT family N-acetyltransferase [Amycolatopsis sp. H20-H5]|uniref:GNAT family N-acetyltransferase n=1 Tax=Amycolatopsis sp. H20-H5 TaxID=3046309 RepID=UPI002DBBF9D2|nr:GNAT family N-acetyltransferase [Amycolatopsis sp. H20-H5]MEC3975253.1 GNAT family N-acetyltransferase [Amycolatopsis sp. H20-H5]
MLLARFTRRGRRMAMRDCDGPAHVFRSGSFLFRTPTQAECWAGNAAGSDPEAQRWLGWLPPSIVAAEFRDHYLRVVPGSGIGFSGSEAVDLVMIDLAANRCAGLVSVHQGAGGSPETGGYLAPAYRGRGLGRELFAAGIRLGHEHLGLTRVRAGVEVGNFASIRSLEAAGMAQVDGPPLHTLPNGEKIVSLWYQHDSPSARRCTGPQRTWYTAPSDVALPG